MRKNQKILLKKCLQVSAICFFSMIVFFTSCRKDSSINPNNGTSLLNSKTSGLSLNKDLSTYSNLGIQHNRRLDSIYDILKSKQNPANSLDVVDSLVVESNHNNKLSDNFQNSLDSMSHSQKNFYKSSLAKKVPTANLIPTKLYSDAETSKLTPGQLKYLDQLNAIIRTKNPSIDQILKSISSIEQQAIVELDDQEIVVVLSTTSIAKSTMQYWHDNYIKWQMLSGNKKLQTSSIKRMDAESPPSGFSWSTLGLTDVAGGASGAIYAAVMNAFPAAGQVAWTSTIVAYAAAASAYYAVYGALNGF